MTSGSAPGGSFHGRARFDPICTSAQILFLQLCFYVSYICVLWAFHTATGTKVPPLLDQMLDHSRVTLAHLPGCITCAALVVSLAGPTAVAFVAVVGRARRAPDFSATLLAAHAAATAARSGVPRDPFWWLLNVAAAGLLAAVAAAVSLRLELREIAVSGMDSGGANDMNRR